MDSLLPRLSAPNGSLALVVTDAEGHEDSLDDHGLAAMAAHHVARLRARRIEPGDTVAVFTEPALETLVALLAQTAAGYVSVPIDPKLGSAELSHMLADAKPLLAVSAKPEAIAARLTSLPAASGLDVIGVERSAGHDPALPPRPMLSTPSLVLYTSGTTGLPKGALISSTNIAACLDGLAEAWAWDARDTIVHALPVFHVHGLVLGLFGAIRRGGVLSWVPRFTPEGLARALDRVAEPSRAMLFAVPTMHHRLAEAAEKDPDVRDALASAHKLVSGSAALPVREHERIFERTGKRVLERYGMTETLITIAVRDGAPRPGYVGLPIAGVEAKLVDETRAEIIAMDDATVGELAVRGATVFLGYLNRPEATREILDAEGWLYTGDLATRAPDGAIRIVGRRSTDLIKCGGYKVGAGEVEAVLFEHPRVREAAVLARPDPDLGERIVAFVVLEAGATLPELALDDHVAKLLSPHKRPREVHAIEALPRNAMGKVQKALLRDRLTTT
jgi:malonyl-CoA/methylmalonyl-CoA synthetase